MEQLKAMGIFAQVIELGSMSAAARKLNLTTSAISQQIQSLEQFYGVKLLNRTTRQLSLTIEGQIVLQGTQQIQHILQQTCLDLEQLTTNYKGLVRISLPSGFLDSFAFQNFMFTLAKQYPQIQLSLQPDDEIVNLIDGDIDIAIRAADPPTDSLLVARYLTQWQLGLYASPDYLQHHPIHSLNDLYSTKWIKYNEITFNNAFDYLNLGPFSANHILCRNILSARSLAVAGIGITFLLSGEVERHLQQGLLVRVLPDVPLPKYNLHTITAHRSQAAKIKAVLHLLKQSFNE